MHSKIENGKSKMALTTYTACCIIAMLALLLLSAARRTRARGITVNALEIDSGRYTPRTAQLYDNAYALLIGIDKYEKTGFKSLKRAVDDMRTIHAKLKEFQFTQIVCLTISVR